MSDDATGFVGSIPENYDRGLGPIIFADYAEHTARLVAGYAGDRRRDRHSYAVPARSVADDDEADRNRPQPADALRRTK